MASLHGPRANKQQQRWEKKRTGAVLNKRQAARLVFMIICKQIRGKAVRSVYERTRRTMPLSVVWESALEKEGRWWCGGEMS